MTLEVPHHVVFLDKTWCMRMTVNPKCVVMALASLLTRGDQQQRPGTLPCMLEHKMNLFWCEFNFVSGMKSEDYHNLINGENIEHCMVIQLLPNLEEPSLIVMSNASYQGVLLDKPLTQIRRKYEIFYSLQWKGISSAEGSLKAELLNLATANTSSRQIWDMTIIQSHNSSSASEQILLVKRLGLFSASFSIMPWSCSCTSAVPSDSFRFL